MEQRIIDSPTGPVRCRTLEDFPGYWIAEDGTVWSTRMTGPKTAWNGWRQSRSFSNGHGGYCRISFRPEPGGIVVTTYVHKLVLEAFGGARPDGMECCHNDGNPSNNRIENLRWGTKKENAADCTKHGRRHVSVRGYNAKLYPMDVIEIRRCVGAGECRSSIAKRYGVISQTIGSIINGRSWREVKSA